MLPACSGWARAAKRNREWIAASRALRVRTLLPRSCLEVVEEAGDQWRVEIGEVQHGRCHGDALGRVAQQQSQRVAVGGDGVAAGLSLGEESVGEERLQRRSERAHRCAADRCARWASSRWPGEGHQLR